ncbi:MAG TPA: SDR family NAD(P)-dependent oxidoreductase, partial [Candidatus Angelobacter sp.]|nr:SDR family NAD(P)-dependent oxidoreductase [Candidatus Angelobacter sp.]
MPGVWIEESRRSVYLLLMQIQGKVVVVTGGANGIGRALCLKFAKEGAKAVVVSDIDKDHGMKVAKEIEPAKGGFIACNVAQEADVRRLVDAATDTFGQVDIFCSNA